MIDTQAAKTKTKPSVKFDDGWPGPTKSPAGRPNITVPYLALSSMASLAAAGASHGSGHKRRRGDSPISAATNGFSFAFPMASASGLKTLHPYQVDGVNWMWRIWSVNLPPALAVGGGVQQPPVVAAYVPPAIALTPSVPGGCLADDMGLGKVHLCLRVHF